MELALIQEPFLPRVNWLNVGSNHPQQTPCSSQAGAAFIAGWSMLDWETVDAEMKVPSVEYPLFRIHAQHMCASIAMPSAWAPTYTSRLCPQHVQQARENVTPVNVTPADALLSLGTA